MSSLSKQVLDLSDTFEYCYIDFIVIPSVIVPIIIHSHNECRLVGIVMLEAAAIPMSSCKLQAADAITMFFVSHEIDRGAMIGEAIHIFVNRHIWLTRFESSIRKIQARGLRTS
jgi:hypothetical protein